MHKFVELTATAPAKLYNLHPRKGSIAIGADADLAIWDPHMEITLTDQTSHDMAGYTPYAGRRLRGWPTTVIRRGEIIVDGGRMTAKPGSGAFLPRGGGAPAAPSGRGNPDLDLAARLGAKFT